MAAGKFYYASWGDTCFLKMTGKISYTISFALDRFLDKVLAEKKYRRFIIDLTGVKWIDSTNLGLLARIARYTLNRFSVRPVLISTSEDLNQLLSNMKFDLYFRIVARPVRKVKDYRELRTGASSAAVTGRVMLAAHRDLMELDPRNREKFAAAAELLKKDLKKRRGSEAPPPES